MVQTVRQSRFDMSRYKFLEFWDCYLGGIKEQLNYLDTSKYVQWNVNGHLFSFIGWIVYRYILWSSIKHGTEKNTNDIRDIHRKLPEKMEHETLNVFGFDSI